jgi:regulator of replication initiation timing
MRRRGRRNQVLLADQIRKHHALQEESDELKFENQKLRGRLDQLECKLLAVYSSLRLTAANAPIPVSYA